MLHIASRQAHHRAGRSIRTLCGIWNAPTVDNPGWAGSNSRRPKQACPACVRLSQGGKK